MRRVWLQVEYVTPRPHRREEILGGYTYYHIWQVEYVTPRPHRREEILIFGGVLEVPYQESEVLDTFLVPS